MAQGYFFFFVNISNIRSVTTKPPTTFSVPKNKAKIPKMRLSRLDPSLRFSKSACPTRMIPPIMITPLIAFAPDIKGVCKTDGTLEITSKPRKTVSAIINIAYYD